MDLITKTEQILKDVLQKVSAERSRMGAYTNGMEHLIAAENNTIENKPSSVI